MGRKDGRMNLNVTLLVADDNEEFRETLATILRLKGFRVITTNSGQDAFQLLKLHEVRLVLSDLEMPQGDGYWLLAKIREAQLAVPCIILSGSFVEEEDLIAAGAWQLIPKDQVFKTLFQVIERLLNCAPSHN
jgi:CheY-like chemotaxis protein